MSDIDGRICVLVTGSRTWANWWQFRTALDPVANLVPYGRVILFHGACPTGADRLADEWAASYARPTVEVRRFPAEQYGAWPQCGPIRNSAMVKAFADETRGHERRVFAFRSTGKSNGTDDCVAKCRRAGLVVDTFHEEPADA